MRTHLLAILLLSGSPMVAFGQAPSLDDAAVRAADALKASRAIGAAGTAQAADRPTVKKLLAAGGTGRVTDAQADVVVKRLAKIRDDAAGQRGGEIKDLLAECDADGDGRVSLLEARRAVAEARPVVDPRASVADRLITAVDKDGDGQANKTELVGYLQSLGGVRVAVEPLAARLWNAADTSRDESVDVMEARLLADQFGRLQLYSGDSGELIVDPTAWIQVVRVIERVDADGSHGISEPEVAATTVFKTQFAALDRDHSGEVTAREFYAMASDLSQTAQRETCATCPRVKQAGADKLNVLQSLLTLR